MKRINLPVLLLASAVIMLYFLRPVITPYLSRPVIMPFFSDTHRYTAKQPVLAARIRYLRLGQIDDPEDRTRKDHFVDEM